MNGGLMWCTSTCTQPCSNAFMICFIFCPPPVCFRCMVTIVAVGAHAPAQWFNVSKLQLETNAHVEDHCLNAETGKKTGLLFN